MGDQSIEGKRNVQIQHVHGSSIQINFGDEPHLVPLEQATVPVSERAKSPARLVRARSGVVPYVAREDLMAELERWVTTSDPFAGQIIGGGGGSGKTRLAVELCRRLEPSGWLCGFLTRIADAGALGALVEAPTPRLIVIDYAESRLEQLEQLLPLLQAHGTAAGPVRVLLLVRAGPRRTSDWTERLRNRSDILDALLDDCEVRVLENEPLEPSEREALFTTAAEAFAKRVEPAAPVPEPLQTLREPGFSSPLMVVIAAYISVHGNPTPPSTRTALLDELLGHEERYWRASAPDLFGEPERDGGATNESDLIEERRQLLGSPLEHRDAHDPILSFRSFPASRVMRALSLLRSASTNARRCHSPGSASAALGAIA
jgi:hypothetical protein